METVTISKQEYEDLKRKSDIDMDFLKQMIESLKDIKCGNVVRVK